MPRGRKRQIVPDDGVAPASAPTPRPAEPTTISFTPIDRGALWARLRLNASQIASLSGATLRQVMFWSDQGYLPHVPGDPRSFSGVGLDTALLLVQARAAGLRYNKAAEIARRYLAGEFTGTLQPAKAKPSALGAGLRALEESARELREQMTADEAGAETAD